MFTQCPNCETTFQVSAKQLKAANGDVRCGECLTVFSALDHLSESIEAGSKNHEIDHHASERTSKDSASDAQHPTTGDASSSIDQNLEEFFGDLFEDSPDETFDEPITYAKAETSTEDKPKTDGGFFYGANEATIEKILETESELDTKTETRFETNVETILEPDSESDLLESPVETNNEFESPEFSSKFGGETGQTDTEANPEDSSTENKTETTQTTDVPSVILDELQAAKEQQLKPPSSPSWLVGSIVLMLVFVLQAVYFSRDSLARNPSYRPLLTNACDVLGCEINIKFDSRLIEIIGRDVRTHPSSKKALIAGTTLINNATYAQPYPLLTLTFSDITGTKLAQRRFTPREYLRSDTDIVAGMPSEVPIQVELHLVDPGKKAVNFEFIAKVDPRS